MSRDPDALDTPQAGPSRISPRTHALGLSDEEDEDTELTPKLLTKPHLDPGGYPRVPPLESGLTAETPAARLRALLARVAPSASASTSSRPPVPPSLSVSESESEAPNATAPSLARESLRDIFSRALLDDTPRKDSSRRRNSIDFSEVEDSPRVENVVKERAKIKGKRRSMSDEEAEKFSKSSQKSEGSLRSSAATFDALRQRLQSSSSGPPLRPPEESMRNTERTQRGFSLQQFISTQSAGDPGSQSDMELSDGPAEASGETATLTRHLDREFFASTSQMPAATPTTLKSFQMPSQIQMQSNLMDQDSEMHNVMQGSDSSYEGPSRATQRGVVLASPSAVVDISSVSFPLSRPNETTSSPRAHNKSHSVHGLPVVRRVSGGSSSRSSSMSANELQDRIRESEGDKFYDRERSWNKPAGRSPSHPATPEHNRRASGGSPSYNTTIRVGSSYGFIRRGSAASMQNFEDGRSSVASSISSRADYHDGSKETDPDKLRERERMWNKPQRSLSRSSSSLSLRSSSDRPRTSSIPTRPDSAQSFHSAQRPPSWHSTDGGSPSSPMHSKEKDYWVEWERERNWRSPNPKWEHQVPRPLSPLPDPPEPGPSPYTYRGISKDSPLHPFNRSPRFRLPSYGCPSRTRTQSMSEHPSTRLYSPLKHSGTDSRIPRPSTPSSSRPSSGDPEDNAQTEGYASRFGWSFPRNRKSSRPAEAEEYREASPQPQASSSKTPAPSFMSRNSQIPVRSTVWERFERERDQLLGHRDAERKKGHRRSSAEFNEPTGQVSARMQSEPVEISTEVEPEAPTDTETESDAESHATTEPTPLARPAPLPAPQSPVPPRTPPLATSTPHGEISNDTEQFYSMAAKPPSPPSTPPKEPASPEHSYSLQTPPRWAQGSASKMEFETPSPPRHMPDLPGPPSSSEEEPDERHTPVGNHFTSLSNMKTPRPPGGWEATPAPTERAMQPEAVAAANDASALETLTPEPAQPSESAIIPTPAPPGGWLPTPAASIRRKSILKVRFDVDPNTSGDSLASVPMVGPTNESMSDIFPPVDPTSARDQKSGAARDSSDIEDRPSTPPTVRARKGPRSPGRIRILDAFGREAPEDETASTPEQPEVGKKASSYTPASTTISKRRGPFTPVRIVDAMGREVTEVSIEDSEHSESYDVPVSRTEALARVRRTITHLVEELGDSDTSSREILPRNDPRLSDLYEASSAARTARKNIHESLQKHKSIEDDLRVKYESLREGMNRSKLLPPVVSPSKYSINFLNTWVLWILFIFQMFVLIYMYHLSTIRAKQIFLTTYYDAFYPDLFLHLTKYRATPSLTSWSLSTVSDTLIRAGLKGLLSELWGNMTFLVDDVRNTLWDAWGQQRTPSWPPT